MAHPLHLVDVFAEARYEGNQLAVVLDAGDLGTEDMQRIALETNFSETTFVTGGDPERGYDVRIFTPTYEMPFAGHPTLGTAWVLRELGGGEASVISLELSAGTVPVRFDADLAWLSAPPTRTIREVDPNLVARALGLERAELDPEFPVQLLSSGPDFLCVPVTDLASLRRSQLDLSAFEPLRELGIAAHAYLFCRGARSATNHMSVRMFFDANGLREDPATGSAAVCLGHYLVEHRYFGSDAVDIRLEQGEQALRPSLLHLRADTNKIEVGGRVIPVARGELL